MAGKPLDKNYFPLQKPAMNLRGPRKDPKTELMKAAGMYEKHFLNEMVKAMRGTVDKSQLIPDSMANKIFSQKLDNEYVQNWSKSGGIGLSKVIYDQMLEKFGPALGITNKIQMPKGPMPLNKVVPAKIHKLDSPAKEATSFQLEIDSKQQQNDLSLNMLWKGKVVNAYKDENGFNKILVNHDNKLQSAWAFQGNAVLPKTGETINSGDSFASLSPNVSKVNFLISKRNS